MMSLQLPLRAFCFKRFNNYVYTRKGAHYVAHSFGIG